MYQSQVVGLPERIGWYVSVTVQERQRDSGRPIVGVNNKKGP